MRTFKDNWEFLLVGVIVIILLGFFALGINIRTSRADSGWDSDYDYGGGFSDSWGDSYSSSSWGDSYSSSSWSSSGDSYSYNYGSSGDVPIDLIMFEFEIIIIIAIIFSGADNKKRGLNSRIFYNMLNSNSNNHTSHKYEANTRIDMNNDDIKRILPNESLDSLKKMAYEKFIDIQNAWMEFDYDKLRMFCTDELYNTYTAQLDTLKLKNGKNIMEQFTKKEIRILDVKKENSIVTIKVFLRVSFYDYVINQKTNRVIRGTKYQTLTNQYELEFVRTFNESNTTVKCPNCNATVSIVTSNECPYCNSTLVVEANDFVLSKKRIVK